MSVSIGKNCKIQFGTTLIADMVDFSFNISADVLSAAVFGSEWQHTYGSAIKSGTGSLSGLLNGADTDGQVALENAVISGTKITDFRLYIDETNFWTSDTVSDTDAGCYFTNYSTSAASTDITKINVDFSFHGEVHKTTA